MARRFNTNAPKTISMDLTQLQLPPAVIIGKKGVVINALKTITRTNMRVVDGRLKIRGSFKEVSAAKDLVKKIAQDFYTSGKINIQMPTARQVRPKIHVNVDEDGWTTRSSHQIHRESKEEPAAPTAPSTSYSGMYHALDESDEEVEEDVEKSPEWPSISTKEHINAKTTERSWVDVVEKVGEKSEVETQEKASTFTKKPVNTKSKKPRWADVADELSDDEDDEDFEAIDNAVAKGFVTTRD